MIRLIFCILFSCFLSACGKHGDTYNGYIDVDFVYLSSNYPGRLAQLFVHRGEGVNQGAWLFKLEQAPEHFDVYTARYNRLNVVSQKSAVLAQIDYAEKNYQRIQKMRSGNAASQNDLDVAKQNLDVLKAQLAGIETQILNSRVAIADRKWVQSRKEYRASEPGIIFDTYFTEGEYVQGGQPIVSLITPSRLKVVFFIPETALSRTQLNQKIRISSDGSPNMATGRIVYISQNAQYTSPLIYSRDERASLVFRVEAKLDKPNLRSIHLGQPVSLELM